MTSGCGSSGSNRDARYQISTPFTVSMTVSAATSDYRQQPSESAKLASNPEEAALVLVANTILNLDSALELAAALSGGQPRISILYMLRGEATPGLSMTADTARVRRAQRVNRRTGTSGCRLDAVPGRICCPGGPSGIGRSSSALSKVPVAWN